MKTTEIKSLKVNDLCPYCTKRELKPHCFSPTCNLLRCFKCHLNFDTRTGRAATDK